MESNLQAAKQDLLNDFGRIVTDAEALLKAVRDVPGDKAAAVRGSLEAKLGVCKERLRDIQDEAVERTTAAARAADTYVHDNPWTLIGTAALAGFIIGMMVRGRD